MEPLSKKVVLTRDPVHGWAIDFLWACAVCHKEYARQSEAELCCLEKKDHSRRPWLREIKKKRGLLRKSKI